MRTKKAVWLAALLVVVAITALSATQTVPSTHPLGLTAEAQVQGGLSCDAMAGVTVGLAIGALSPCSILCAVGAWYSLAAMGFAGC